MNDAGGLKPATTLSAGCTCPTREHALRNPTHLQLERIAIGQLFTLAAFRLRRYSQISIADTARAQSTS
jgi:hypothetical protein